MKLTENEHLKYRVINGGSVLLESASRTSAEAFVATLSKDLQESVEVIAVTKDGAQVLLG